ncbi:unnamed protein product [Scytosiphon promiscuus]
MHTHGRAPLMFNEQNLAAIRKVLAPGPLPLLPTQQAPAVAADSGSRPLTESERARAARRAAVLVPLCNRDGIASLLYTVRSSKVSTHKGQVSFPGGHLEPGEDAIEAALRETREEIGDTLGDIEVLGTCQTLPAVTGTPVTPVLAFVQQDVGQLLPSLVLSPDEVESVFTLSVSELLDPSFRVVDDSGPRGRLPAFTAGPSRVWGLTACITDGVLRNGIIPLLEQGFQAARQGKRSGDVGERPGGAPLGSDDPGNSSL